MYHAALNSYVNLRCLQILSDSLLTDNINLPSEFLYINLPVYFDVDLHCIAYFDFFGACLQLYLYLLK